MHLLIFAILFPFLAAALIPLIHRRLGPLNIGWLVLAVPFILFGIFAWQIPGISSGDTITAALNWIPSLGINFSIYLDGLSLILALLITGMGTLVILYSIYYLSPTDSLPHFYAYLLLFMGAMLGVVLSDNLLVLYVFWELTSISSFLLIAFWFHRKNSRYGAQKSLLITVFGGFGMLAGFLMLHTMTGTFSVREIVSTIGQYSDHALFYPAMFLVLLGAFTKSAQFPFHIWLPDAMEAPTPVSAYLHSATMVKAGIYLVARFTPIFGGTSAWFWTVTLVGLVTLFWGSFCAVRQTDLKALLAYSTVSQLGLIMSLFGMGSAALHFGDGEAGAVYGLATFAALFHLVNHSTFKGALFMVVGIVDHQVGTRDIRRLGGLMAFLPITFTFAVIGSFSMAGLPLFNGFLSKEMFFTASVNAASLPAFSAETWGWLIPVIAWTASVLTFVYCMIIVFRTFFGKHQPKKLDKKPVEPPFGMLVSPAILSILIVGVFFAPNLLGDHLLRPALNGVLPGITGAAPHISAWHGFNTELWMTIGIIVVGFLLYKYLRIWKKVYAIIPEGWTFNALYNKFLESLEENSNWLTSKYMTGYLPHYFAYIFGFFILAAGGTLLLTGALSIDFTTDTPIPSYEVILAVVMAIAAIAILFVKSRLTSVLLNGVLGYSIAIFFVLFRAPDLALTQLVIETVTTALFLLCFYFLPEWKPEKASKNLKIRNAVIAVAGGLTVTLIALSVRAGNLYDSISSYYEDAYELAGGKNIVNAILGDFRGFDTMLETLVLFIAGLGVYTLIRIKGGKETRKNED
ncbi:cation:proton antiporter [Planococcus glaciei]|uniref:Na+/H+ antiporter subunit A n=1 Tax=Planococcus glaciei TaxID=459472 RepID=A0A7H8Q7W4_9BACL|nr:Na+/H+ antiporter subunit A [Planococcus glaciei]ETP69139.1 cation:proton antiporter [Planococcus glaciei CHR43]KOF12020.1 cation:proton antiporter [Planococcus glaciei]QKX49950.1 Na+/H+ antiporter subunit A [Planococcus glaciei]